MDTDITKLSFQIPSVYADKLKTLANGVNKTPSAIIRELITAFCDGQVKLPMPDSSKDVYDLDPTP